MPTLPAKELLYAVLFSTGLVFLGFAAYQYHYAWLVATGNRAVAEQRFDIQHYERAERHLTAQHDALLFNQGVLAYKARNLPRAAEFFRQALHRSTDPAIRMRAQYNLGLVMLALQEADRAAEFFKEALRLDPLDKASKFNLERLYHFVLRQEGDHGAASLQQAPGTATEQKPGTGGEGQGRSPSGAGI